jgi:hypothetical protein
MRERRLPEFVILKLPEVIQLEADVKSDRPVVVSSADRIVEWLSL